MTLTVGERYRGVWGGKPAWLLVISIEVLNNGATIVSYRAASQNWPRILMRIFGTKSYDGAALFVNRLDECQKMDDVEAARAHSRTVAKSISELDVRYR